MVENTTQESQRRREFALRLIEFYKTSLTSANESIKILADIQKNYPDYYESVSEFKDDPMAIDELTENMTPDERDAILVILIRGSNIGKQASRLFNLTVNEKEKLIEDLEKFAAFVEKKLKEIVEKRHGGEQNASNQ